MNVNGKVVADLTKVLSRFSSGNGVCHLTWNAAGLAPGVYFVLLRQNKVEHKRKVVLVR